MVSEEDDTPEALKSPNAAGNNNLRDSGKASRRGHNLGSSKRAASKNDVLTVIRKKGFLFDSFYKVD